MLKIVGAWRPGFALATLMHVTYPVQCSVLLGVCKGTVPAWCYHWLATSAAFIAKVARWSTA